MKTIYLANPYGFSASAKESLLPELVIALTNIGLDVLEPFTRTQQVDMSAKGWSYKVGQMDLSDVKDADGFFGVINGCPPDEGVMIELGAAIAFKKPIFLFRDDFRRCTDSEEYPLNLMVFAGLPEFNWQSCYYTSVEELFDPNKTLYKWAQERYRTTFKQGSRDLIVQENSEGKYDLIQKGALSSGKDYLYGTFDSPEEAAQHLVNKNL